MDSPFESNSSFSSAKVARNVRQGTAARQQDAQTELKLLYRYLSKTFGKDICSFPDAKEIINNTVVKLIKNADQLKEFKSKNDKLNEIINESMNKSAIDELEQNGQAMAQEALEMKLRNYKKKVLSLQDTIAEKDAKIHEILIQLQDAKLELQSKKKELQQSGSTTKACVDDQKQGNIKKPDVNVEQTAQLFEDLIISQENSIQHYSMQQTKLVSLVHFADQVTNDLVSRLSKSTKEKEEIKANVFDLEEQIHALHEKSKEFLQKLESVTPEEMKEEISTRGSFSAISIIETLKSKLEEKPKIVVEKEDAPTEPMVTKRKYDAAIQYLEDALNLVKCITTSHYETIGLEIKNILLTECARIGNWIDSNLIDVGVENLPKQYSIFDPNAVGGPKEQLEIFLNLCSDEELKESPLRELFTVFGGVCDLNKMLLDYNEKLKKQIACNFSSFQSNEIFKRVQNENYYLLNEKDALLEKVAIMERTFKAITGNEEIDFQTILEVAENQKQETQNLISQLQQQKENVELDLAKHCEVSKTKINVLSESLYQIQGSYNKLEQNFKDLTSEKDKIALELSKCQAEKEQIRSECLATSVQLKQKSKQYNDSIKMQKETTSILDGIQSRAQQIVADNENLANTCLQLQEKCNMQKEQLEAQAVVESKLRASRENIKKRYSKLQKQNEELLNSSINRVQIM